VRGAVRNFGVDEAFPVGELATRLPELLADHRRVFHTLMNDGSFDTRLLDVFRRRALEHKRRNAPAHPAIEDPRPAIAELRQIKDATEIAALEEAARISVLGHRRAMAVARPGLMEYEVQAALEAEFRAAGSPRNGYDSIVASGANACILHYVDNHRKMRSGELLLIDAGAEYRQYTADVTRTFPVSGTFTPPQRAIYRAVLAAEQAGIRAVKPGARWSAPHRVCIRVLTRELVKLGLLRGKLPKLIKDGACRKWFMHGTSHWLGADVHDVGPYEQADGKPVKFRPGMVLTVEPGLYFGRTDRSVPREYRGIGVRIEDDVLVTRAGRRVLTAGMPKEIGEIEALCQSAP
jgi:Xaa-Pro aminopeptidase